MNSFVSLGLLRHAPSSQEPTTWTRIVKPPIMMVHREPGINLRERRPEPPMSNPGELAPSC